MQMIQLFYFNLVCTLRRLQHAVAAAACFSTPQRRQRASAAASRRWGSCFSGPRHLQLQQGASVAQTQLLLQHELLVVGNEEGG